jgi:hypothetical protein
MSTSTASLPGYGHAFFDEVSRFCSAMFAAPKAKPASTGTRLWNLYLKSAGLDSVNPALLADRIVQD